MWGTPILHDNTQNFNGVLVFADQFFRCKVLYIKLTWVFLFEYVHFITDTFINITESKFTKLKDNNFIAEQTFSTPFR